MCRGVRGNVLLMSTTGTETQQQLFKAYQTLENLQFDKLH
mgnify:CR=1 FL=1